MDKLTKQIIKCKVMQYPRMRDKIANEIADICDNGSNNSVSCGYSSTRNTNGFDKRLAQIMGKEDYLWCEAIEFAVSYYNERGRSEVVKSVDELYWKNKLNADGVAMQLCVSRKHVYNFVDNFFDVVHKFALKNLSLIHI